MSRSIAATVLANAKRLEAEEIRNAKKQEEEARKKAKKQYEEDLKNAKSVIISKVQETMDRKVECLEEWNYITGNDARIYLFDDWINLDSSEIVEVAQSLGFTCEYQKSVFWISIPMWKKGEKKTTAQLMLYHHQMALRKWIKELKAEAGAVAKRDCKEVLARLEKGEYNTNYNSQEYLIIVPIVTEGLQMAFYDEQVRSIMKARGFKNIVLIRNAWQIIFPKEK